MGPLRRTAVIAGWALAIVVAGVTAARLPSILQGGADAIPGSESDRVTRAIRREFGAGSLYQVPVVVHSESLGTEDPRFGAAIESLTSSLAALASVARVETAWNSPRAELLGRDGKSALLVVTPRLETFYQAELLTARLREAIARAALPAEVRADVTGASAMLHDLDRRSSSDLLEAERVALPLAAVILLVVFGAPLAAALPLVLALSATTIGLAGLYLVGSRFVVSVFAQNVVSMIGLGVGVDYALFVLSRFREAMARGLAPEAAALEARRAAGHSVLFSGATVAVGFLALFLVRAPFLHAIALGGVLVVAAAVAAAMTLLPALLATIGRAVDWPRRRAAPERPEGPSAFWSRWAAAVMRRPWIYATASLAVLALFMLPAFRIRAWNIGAADLPVEAEARRGYDALAGRFPQGWMGPIVLLVESRGPRTLWDEESYRALIPVVSDLRGDPRGGAVLGLHQVLPLALLVPRERRTMAELPPELQDPLGRVMSADGRFGIVALVTAAAPEDPATMGWLSELRQRRWPEAERAGLVLRWGGSSAIMQDFDREMFGSARRVILTVVITTFLVLVLMFRSLLIPLKATLLNVVSVLAAYGFLVLVFQDGRGARWIGLDPPGGLNSFIVLMLFTILFGLSMDYEVFLLSRVREEWLASGDSDRAVAAGLARTGGIITSAALIMISIFAAFGFTRLTPTREFGLGLAFAVALDATLIRVVLVPALMKVSGKWNWWWPVHPRTLAAASVLMAAAFATGAGAAAKEPKPWSEAPASQAEVRERLLKARQVTVSAACGTVMAPWAYRGRYGEHATLRPYTRVRRGRDWIRDFVNALLTPADWDSARNFRGVSKPCGEVHEVPLISVTFIGRGTGLGPGPEIYAVLSFEGRDAVLFEADRPLGMVRFDDRADTLFALIRPALLPDSLSRVPDAPPPYDPRIGESVRSDYAYVDSLPQALEQVTPRYPRTAVMLAIEGTVYVQALVGRDGAVHDAFVARSIPALNDAALDAVWKWRFRPAISAGEPVAVWVMVPVRFRLR
ncbi:MAG TPA: TonB family protein [Candidatus Eisenbacteria bacterium]